MKLSTGLEFFQPNFVSSNTAHFGEDDIEEERSIYDTLEAFNN